jgi:hypothetical protein
MHLFIRFSENNTTVKGMLLRPLRHYPLQTIENSDLIGMKRLLLGQVVGGHPENT